MQHRVDAARSELVKQNRRDPKSGCLDWQAWKSALARTIYYKQLYNQLKLYFLDLQVWIHHLVPGSLLIDYIYVRTYTSYHNPYGKWKLWKRMFVSVCFSFNTTELKGYAVCPFWLSKLEVYAPVWNSDCKHWRSLKRHFQKLGWLGWGSTSKTDIFTLKPACFSVLSTFVSRFSATVAEVYPPETNGHSPENGWLEYLDLAFFQGWTVSFIHARPQRRSIALKSRSLACPSWWPKWCLGNVPILGAILVQIGSNHIFYWRL